MRQDILQSPWCPPLPLKLKRFTVTDSYCTSIISIVNSTLNFVQNLAQLIRNTQRLPGFSQAKNNCCDATKMRHKTHCLHDVTVWALKARFTRNNVKLCCIVFVDRHQSQHASMFASGILTHPLPGTTVTSREGDIAERVEVG